MYGTENGGWGAPGGWKSSILVSVGALARNRNLEQGPSLPRTGSLLPVAALCIIAYHETKFPVPGSPLGVEVKLGYR